MIYDGRGVAGVVGQEGRIDLSDETDLSVEERVGNENALDGAPLERCFLRSVVSVARFTSTKFHLSAPIHQTKRGRKGGKDERKVYKKFFATLGPSSARIFAPRSSAFSFIIRCVVPALKAAARPLASSETCIPTPSFCIREA